MERFEIRIHDGFGTFTSIFKRETMAVMQGDCSKLHTQMERMGVTVGRIELRGEDNKLCEAWVFYGARDEANRKRQQARKAAFKARMHAQGFDDDLLI